MVTTFTYYTSYLFYILCNYLMNIYTLFLHICNSTSTLHLSSVRLIEGCLLCCSSWGFSSISSLLKAMKVYFISFWLWLMGLTWTKHLSKLEQVWLFHISVFCCALVSGLKWADLFFKKNLSRISANQSELNNICSSWGFLHGSLFWWGLLAYVPGHCQSDKQHPHRAKLLIRLNIKNVFYWKLTLSVAY